MMNVKFNENVSNIFQYIKESPDYINWNEFIQHCIDYDMYKEFYIHLPIIKILVEQHNDDIRNGVWVKPN